MLCGQRGGIIRGTGKDSHETDITAELGVRGTAGTGTGTHSDLSVYNVGCSGTGSRMAVGFFIHQIYFISIFLSF